MSDTDLRPDLYRRRFLTTAATVVGGAGAAAAAVPFLSMMTPSAKTRVRGGPVEVDVSKLPPRGQIIVQWRGKPVWVLRRDPEILENLQQLGEAELSDPESQRDNQPEYARNMHRSRQAEYLVIIGSCTHLGCSPQYLNPEEPHNWAPWHGGFFCACHGSRFDLSGRVYKGTPAQPNNLVVPPYMFLSDSRILIGKDSSS